MRFAGNLIWFVLGGAITAAIWLLGAVLFAISIVGLPMTRAAIEMAKMSAWPFGKEVMHVRDLDQRGIDLGTSITGTIGFIANVVWALTFGLVLFVMYIFYGIVFCVTIIGIPFGLQSFKLAALSLWPVGRRVVTIETARILRDEKAHKAVSKHRKGQSSESAKTITVTINN